MSPVKTSKSICARFAFELHRCLQRTEVSEPLSFPENGIILLVGNGGSQSVCAHIANDLTKMSRRALCLSDPATLTCLSNDFGYHQAYSHQAITWASNDTLLICVSSSGQSENIIAAAVNAKRAGSKVATFTGFKPDNPLRQLGHWNYWVPSSNYGIVECAHLALLHALVNPGELPGA